ncbi:DUF6457 domain-containing protein [Actinocrispum sp. NPDC049592]|uniref:DUF6457 domain-containing protein n=1 Tax=Actinocrispum sp. NPDC049592 TaxID=3154835 RepID=UPI003425DBFE
MKVIEEWTDLVAADLGVRPEELDAASMLAVARHVARDVCGAAAPLTFYLVGVAVGRGMAPADAVARVATLVERWRGYDWRD